MLTEALGYFVLARILRGNGLSPGLPGGSPPVPRPAPLPLPPTPLVGPLPAPVAPTSPVFPVAPPSSLPPFPGSGWCPDEPPPPEVVARAWDLLPGLWSKGAGTTAQEMTGGRWITYQAQMMGAKRGVAAYRSINCAPVAAPTAAPAAQPATPPATPTPTVSPASVVTPPYTPPTVPAVVIQPPPAPPAQGGNPYGGTMSTAQVQAAVNGMGYLPALVVDGKYGALTTAGVKWAQGQLNLGGHVPVLVVDGKAGPLTQAGLQDWGHAPATIPAATPPAPAPTAPSAPMTNQQIQQAVNGMGYTPALVVDGKIGPKSVAGIKWAQQHMNALGWTPALKIDGIAGPLTQAAFESQQTA